MAWHLLHTISYWAFHIIYVGQYMGQYMDNYSRIE